VLKFPNFRYHGNKGQSQKILLHHTQKLCSKFGEDRSLNHVTVLSTDAGQRRQYTGDRTRQMILYSVPCCYA